MIFRIFMLISFLALYACSDSDDGNSDIDGDDSTENDNTAEDIGTKADDDDSQMGSSESNTSETGSKGDDSDDLSNQGTGNASNDDDDDTTASSDSDEPNQPGQEQETSTDGEPNVPDSGDTTNPDTVDGGDDVSSPQLAVSADFVNQSLSIVDLSKLVPGATRKDALVGTIDLKGYRPGPLDFAITPDGKTAVVSVSAGWLRSFDPSIPSGDGTVLIVDLENRKVVKNMKIGASPMGVVITKDGKRAFVGIYGSTMHLENYIVEIDIEKQTSRHISTGGSYNEELAIDDTGTVAILTYGTSGNVKTFNVDSPAQQGATRGLSSDAAGVAFFPGTKTAFLVQSPTVLTGNMGGHNIINVNNPQNPVASDNVRSVSPSWYPATPVPHRKSVAVPTLNNNNSLTLVEWKLQGNKAVQEQTIPVINRAQNIAYGASVDKKGRVLLASPSDKSVSVVDLDKKESYTVNWGVNKVGPTSIRVIP